MTNALDTQEGIIKDRASELRRRINIYYNRNTHDKNKSLLLNSAEHMADALEDLLYYVFSDDFVESKKHDTIPCPPPNEIT